MGTSAKPEPQQPQDELDFLGPAGSTHDELDFLGESNDELDFLGTDTTSATPEPAPVSPIADSELSPELRLSDLANRPGITATQKARIQRLMHAQRRSMNEEEDAQRAKERERYAQIGQLIQQGDVEGAQALAEQHAAEATLGLGERAALEYTQGALHLPESALKTVGRVVPAAKTGGEAIETFRQGIEPETTPEHPLIQATIDALSTAAGELRGGVPLFKSVSGTVGVGGAIAKAAAPRLAARAEAQLAELAARALARTGSTQLAKAILAAPKELVAGTVFQGLLDPESLKTPAGIAMAFLFGTVGALGEGVRVSRMVEAEKAAATARQATEQAAKAEDPVAKQAAEIEAKAAETKAEEAARSAGKRSWDTAKPEMRSTLLPGMSEAMYRQRWNKLSPDAQTQIIARLRVAASDSKLNTSKPTTGEPPAPPAPPSGDKVAVAVTPEGTTADVVVSPAEQAKLEAPAVPATTAEPSSAPAAEPTPAPTPTPEPTPAAAGPGESMGTVEVVRQATDLVGRDGLAREVASVLKKRKSVPATPDGMGAIVEAVARKIVDRQAAGGEKPAAGKVEAPAEAPRVEETRAPAVDDEITRLQAELEQERSARLQTERRAHAAERAAETDNLTGLQNQNAWTSAQHRIDADPNSHIILVDVKNLHAFNKKHGQAVGDEYLRTIGQSIREVLTPADQAFRVGGDEFAVVTTPDFANIMRSKLANAVKDMQIEGTEFSTGIRLADGKTYADASRSLVEVAAAEKGTRARPVDILPPAEKTSFKEEVAPTPAEPVKPKKRGKNVPPPPVRLTRGQVDYNATRNLTEPQLQGELIDFLQRFRQETDPVQKQSLQHDLNLIRREIRMREPIKELSDQALETHANEMKALWEQLPPDQRGPIEARLAEADIEFKRRAKPDPLDAMGDERYTFPGGLLRDVDPLEAKTGTQNLPPHSQRIQESIVVDVNDRPYPGIQELMRGLRKLYAHAVRGTYAADVATRQLGLQNAPAVRNPGVWAELLSGSPGRAQRMLEEGPFQWLPDGNIQEVGVKSYKQILKGLRGRLNELRRYERAKDAIELLSRAKEPGVQMVDAVREINSAPPEIVQAANESSLFRQAVLQYLTDGGMFGQAAREAVTKMTQSLFPMYRWMEGGELKPGKVIDPIRATVDMTRRFIRAADLNRLGVMLVEAAEANPDMAKGLIWKETRVRTALDPTIQQQAGALRVIARNNGINITGETATEIAIGLNNKRLREPTNTLHVWRNGKREIWAISPELAEMYQHFQPHEMHWLLRAAGFIPQIAKTGITDNPIFGFFNAWKDTFDATAQSRYGFRWGIDSMIGFFHSLTNSKFKQEFRASAGTAGGIAGSAIGSTESAMRAVLPKTPAERATALVLHPIDALREMSVPFEEAARLGEYVRARGAGAPAMDAAIASQRVTTNFRQRGLSMQGISHIVMFLNPAIQSLDTMVRAGIRNPGKVVATMFAAVTLPSIYLWAANKGDKDIEELRKSRFGSGYWFYRKNNGQIGRLSKPFTFGAVFGTGAEDALDALYDKDPTAGDRFIQTLVDQLPYNVVPTVMNLTLGLIYNKDFSTGAPIAPDQLESGTGEVEPRFQARPETGPTARAIGDILNVSPAKVEYTVRNATGTLGQDILRGIDMLNDAKSIHPAPMAAEAPVVGRLLAKYPSTGAFNLRRFYDDAKKVEIAANSVALLEKEGNESERLLHYMDHHRREIALAEAYAGFRKELATLRSQTDYIATLPANSMTPEEKRRLIDLTVSQMIVYARDANEAILNSTKGVDFSPQFDKKPIPAGTTKETITQSITPTPQTAGIPK